MDFLLVDIQGLRGSSRFEAVARLLNRRSTERPTVLMASGPCDLVSLAEGGTLDQALFCQVGRPLSPIATEIRLVGRDRLEAERKFEFAFGGLKDGDPTDVKLLSLAKSAWWACRQRFAGAEQENELRKFDAAFVGLESENPTKANMLRLGKELLDRHARDEQLETERRGQVIEATVSAHGASGVLVLTRNWQQPTSFAPNWRRSDGAPRTFRLWA
ncbi:MAG TPA: hypothetical protein VGK32_18490 [Vicinamibacterales bacterium]